MKSVYRLTVCLVLVLFISSCIKNASCSDGKKNQNETGLDCGGDCKACPTCWDGIKNMDETEVDCGGICPKCATCNDGLKNQNETGVDCGGVCGKCQITYPQKGQYGSNILREDTITVAGGIGSIPIWLYSLTADVPENDTLKVVIYNTSPLVGTEPLYPSGVFSPDIGTKVGWQFDVNQNWNTYQEYKAVGKSRCDVRFGFTGDGSAQIDFIVNRVLVRKKYITWKQTVIPS